MNTDRITITEYRAKKQRLRNQLHDMQKVVQFYADNIDVSQPIEESVSDAWNAAHDAVTALEASIKNLEHEWASRDVDPVTQQLVQHNID